MPQPWQLCQQWWWFRQVRLRAEVLFVVQRKQILHEKWSWEENQVTGRGKKGSELVFRLIPRLNLRGRRWLDDVDPYQRLVLDSKWIWGGCLILRLNLRGRLWLVEVTPRVRGWPVLDYLWSASLTSDVSYLFANTTTCLQKYYFQGWSVRG